MQFDQKVKKSKINLVNGPNMNLLKKHYGNKTKFGRQMLNEKISLIKKCFKINLFKNFGPKMRKMILVNYLFNQLQFNQISVLTIIKLVNYQVDQLQFGQLSVWTIINLANYK
jgi:hypothetical protein